MSNEKYSTIRLKHLFLAPCLFGHNQVNHKEIKEKNKGFDFCKTDKKQAAYPSSPKSKQFSIICSISVIKRTKADKPLTFEITC